MNFGAVALKALVAIALLFLLSLAGAITFPFVTVFTNGAGAGIASILFLLAAMLALSIVGNLMARGIRSIKKPIEALILAFVGAFFIGAALALLALLNIPYAAHINLQWLGTSWYSPILAMLLIGAPLMLVFIVGE
jgi:hypothetical protein